jgi:hypothetical protein
VIGIVDESLRALLDVPVAAAKGDERTSIRVWIDTAFNGGLVRRFFLVPEHLVHGRSSR